MQCVKLLKKRSLDLEPWDCCKTKRLCLGAELVAECPMETCDSSNLSNQLQPQQSAQVGTCCSLDSAQPKPNPGPGPSPGLVCQRCLRGEPGHINHILGL